mmetsp:Transcript_5351/g.13652  ORF Transcript_5351/g.13652 Transcript_5351/m.13652 type:complete len:239 (+) Transcript_5351:125-841(+)
MSASSNTTCRMCVAPGAKFPRRHAPSLNPNTSSTARAGVATTMSGSVLGSAVSGVSMVVRSSGLPSSPTSELATRVTCSHRVALGHMIRAPSLPAVYPPAASAWLSRLENTGARYVSVLPLPVSAAMTTSPPRATNGIARLWMPVPALKPSAASAVTTEGCRGSSANGRSSASPAADAIAVAAEPCPGASSEAAAEHAMERRWWGAAKIDPAAGCWRRRTRPAAEAAEVEEVASPMVL